MTPRALRVRQATRQARAGIPRRLGRRLGLLRTVLMTASTRFPADTEAVADNAVDAATASSAAVVVGVEDVVVGDTVVDVVMASSAVVGVDAALRVVMAGWRRGRRRAWSLFRHCSGCGHQASFWLACDRSFSEGLYQYAYPAFVRLAMANAGHANGKGQSLECSISIARLA